MAQITTLDRKAGEPTTRASDDRALRRLRHRDEKELTGLMDDYLALADELEEIDTRATDPGPPPSRHAA